MQSSAEIEAYLTGQWLTDLANFSAFVFHTLPGLNWSGFYLNHGDKLRLGPFVGKPACTEIAFNRGVCGAAFSGGVALIVADVHEFPGHIACDSASRSEMVIPLIYEGKSLGVFDLDSPELGRFKAEEQEMIESWLKVLLAKNPGLARSPWCGGKNE